MREFEIRKERAEIRGENICMDCSTDLQIMCVNEKAGGRTEIDLCPDSKTPLTHNEMTIEECRRLLGQKITIYQKQI